ncbi:MAG: response regulator [Desulfobacterales bacterium]|jgi:CheY-like chemotaxis protein|nr:response regulator [Desulfobacterales bacterium]
MNYRAFIFDDQKDIRQVLCSLFDRRGYEVFAFPHPGTCPLSEEEICPCPIEQTCTDVILSDVNMPIKNGLNFLEEQIQKGCRCKHFALMSGDFTDGDVSKAKSLGIKIFKKPFKLKEVINWLDQIENDIDPKRKLSDWFLERMPQISED